MGLIIETMYAAVSGVSTPKYNPQELELIAAIENIAGDVPQMDVSLDGDTEFDDSLAIAHCAVCAALCLEEIIELEECVRPATDMVKNEGHHFPQDTIDELNQLIKACEKPGFLSKVKSAFSGRTNITH